MDKIKVKENTNENNGSINTWVNQLSLTTTNSVVECKLYLTRRVKNKLLKCAISM